MVFHCIIVYTFVVKWSGLSHSLAGLQMLRSFCPAAMSKSVHARSVVTGFRLDSHGPYLAPWVPGPIPRWPYLPPPSGDPTLVHQGMAVLRLPLG